MLSATWLVVRRRAWIPLLFALLATAAMGALTLASKPTYVATATVIAKNPENATDRPLSFPEVVTSNTVALRAIKTAHVLETVDELEAALSVVSGKSDIYQIAIRDTDAARATALANAVAGESTAQAPVPYQDIIKAMDVSVKVGFIDVGLSDPAGLAARPSL